MIGYQLAKDYENNTLNGWLESKNPGLIKEYFNVMGTPPPLKAIRNKGGGKRMGLHLLVRKLLGKDTPNIAQEIGDCVSWGAKNATEHLTCAQIIGHLAEVAQATGQDLDEVIKSSQQKFRYVFSPYYYGTGRVYVGGGRLGNDDGSLGSWQADAVKKFGTLFLDDEDVPSYSGRVAKAWGDRNSTNDLDKFKNLALDNPVRKTQLVRNWDELYDAVVNNLTPVTIASGVGFNMEASSDGFHRHTTNWAHQMMIYYVDESYKNGEEHYAIIRNSWSDVHGRLKDFHTGEELPIGSLRVRRKDIEKILREGDSYSYGEFEAEKADLIDKSLFRVMGG